MNLKPRQLRIFMHLAQTLSFRATADQFCVTQPTLSRALQDLEVECGVKLFERTTRQVRLTHSGHELLGIAARIIDAYDEGLAELAHVAQKREQRFAIASLPSLASLLLPEPLAELRDKMPEIKVHVRDVYAEAAIEMLRNRQVDVALSSISTDQDDLHYEAVTKEGFALVVSRKHYAGIDINRWSPWGIDGVPLIAMWRGTGTRNCVDAAFKRKGMTFRPIIELQHLSVMADFVRGGFGITILPFSGARMIRDENMLTIPMEDIPSRAIAIITRREYCPDQALRNFLDKVHARIGSLPFSEN